MRIIRNRAQAVNNGPLTFAEVKVQAHGQWTTSILPALLIDSTYLNRREGPCPRCGGATRYRYDDKNGNGDYHCSHCGPGDGFELLKIVNGWAASQALRAVSEYLNIGQTGVVSLPRKAPENATRDNDPPIENEAVKKANAALWLAGLAITPGDPVYTYLRRTRRLELEAYPHCLRYHPRVGYYNEYRKLEGHFPAMLALVVDHAGHPVAVHKTYLTESGFKAPVDEPKKLSRSIYPGATQGAAIRLFEAGHVLAVGEGIETMLAVHLLADGFLPVWACRAAVGIESLAVPKCVNRLIICGDNDESNTGQKAAKRLAARQIERGVTCQIITPEIVGHDWADVLLDEVSNHGI